ncbi:hypothetical protein SAMN06265365_101316 [Tistlia consotensis]|uniref:Uncharacterized protein n=1 Tax=Tistlia consotensis USBA 355 TaxID=560819 RepID=A0A1Y6B3X7_9PROT|nr:DUF4286 family protein [Tistlia consotensis]SME90438.1 hypothetical protein SAMN05428998_101314 [Tistlia consotensis USBA 355]SNR26742.1 hypothetical protein SAMN06265365_101316 [Tistlia consotensis]
MSLIGRAVVAIWNDILPEGRENFIEWHDRQHIPERVAIPGFHRGRRLVAERGSPEYFTLYEARDEAVLVGPDYLERLNNPTDWTRRSTADFRNTARGVCRTVWSHGAGEGGTMLTLRFDAEPRNAALLKAHLTGGALAAIQELPGVTGVHLCIADPEASGLETAERKGREVGVPSWIILVEGVSSGAVDTAADRLVEGGLEQRGAVGLERGVYRLEFSLREDAEQ